MIVSYAQWAMAEWARCGGKAAERSSPGEYWLGLGGIGLGLVSESIPGRQQRKLKTAQSNSTIQLEADFIVTMRFTFAVIAVALALETSSAFRPAVVVVSSRPSTALASTAEEQRAPTKKEERLRMMKSERFHRKGFKEVRDVVEQNMQEQFQSSIVKDLRESNYLMEKDGVKVYLAKVRWSVAGLSRSCLGTPHSLVYTHFH